MPQTFKKAEYKASRDVQPYKAKRAEWYRTSEGLTVGQRITGEGEILHISELDTDVLDPTTGQTYKAETFEPLSLPEQERRFGRIMYMPYEPTDDELQQLGWERNVVADEIESSDQLDELHGEDYDAEIDAMGEPQLRQEASFRYGVNFPAGMPARSMRMRLLKLYHEGDEEEITEQMKSNVAQRLGTTTAYKSSAEVHDKIDEDRKLVEESVEETDDDDEDARKAKKAARRRAKAAKKIEEADNTDQSTVSTTQGETNA